MHEETPGRIADAASKIAKSGSHAANINLDAPAGTKDSLGEESVRDGRPATDDSIVEAIDEETPVTPGLPDL
jgi:hypothetical protein